MTLRGKGYLHIYTTIGAVSLIKEHFECLKCIPNDTSAGMLRVHLFFSKHLGCSIKEGNISLDTNPLANGIKDIKSVPNFWIAIGPTPGIECVETVSADDLMVANDTYKNQNVAATQLYTCGSFSVQMVYSLTNETIYDMPNKWHPMLGTKLFKLSNLNAET